MTSLTSEQKQRIEASRQKALALRQQRNQQQSSNPVPVLNKIAFSGPNLSYSSSNRTAASTSSVFTRIPDVKSGPTVGHVVSNKNWHQSSKPPNNKYGNNSRFSGDKLDGMIDSLSNNDDYGKSSKICAVCVLVSRERFEVQMAYHMPAIDVFKRIRSRSYDGVRKIWSFSLHDYRTLQEEMRALTDKVYLELLPRVVQIAFADAIAGRALKSLAVPEIELKPMVDTVLHEALFPFQLEGIRYIVNKKGRVLLADDMGLGKTIQALGAASFYRMEWPLLIVCPSSVRCNWKEAILRWLPSVDPENIWVLNSAKDFDDGKFCEGDNQSIVVVTYDLLANQKLFKKTKFGVVVLDESHFIKNYKTKRFKAIEPITKNAKRLIMLSGTPALSRPEELYSQVSCLNPGVFGTFKDYATRYCDAKVNKWGMDTSGSSNTGELKLLLEETIMLRRMKDEVLSELPKKSREMIILDRSSVKTNLQALRKAAAELQKENLRGQEKQGAWLKFYAESAPAKADAVKDYLMDMLEGGNLKILVFAHHRIMLDELSNALMRKKIEFIRIDGTFNSSQRKRLCDDFQTDESIKVALLSITATNVGITLTAANLVVFAELYWNPGALTQAEDRAHRVGQDQNVRVQYLVAKETADDFMWPLIQEKLTVLNQVGLSTDNFKNADQKTVRNDLSPAKVEASSSKEASVPPKSKTLLDFFEFLEDDNDDICVAAADAVVFDDDDISDVFCDVTDDEPSQIVKRPRMDND